MNLGQDDAEWAAFGNSEMATLQTAHIFKMNFPEIVDIALPAEGVFHNLVFVSIRKTYPMQAYKIMHGLWGMGRMMFTRYLIVGDAECLRTATRRSQHQRSPLPPLRQHRPATRQHFHRSRGTRPTCSNCVAIRAITYISATSPSSPRACRGR